jgi:hypothetical protein
LSKALVEPSPTTFDASAVFAANANRGRWTVTLQGNILQVQQAGIGIQWVKQRRRGPASPFSQASRRRLLFRLARIDWQACRHARFITLTYPDVFADRPLRRRTIDRDMFHRDMEKLVGKHTAAIWRTEWQVRKSGERKGQPMPHVHVILFTSRFIPFQYVNNTWKNILGYNNYVRTEVERAGQVRDAARYCAKYLTKHDDLSLVIASYLSRVRGRPWGIKRPKLLPWAPCVALEDVPPDLVCELRRRAAIKYRPIGDSIAGGFTLLGEDAARMFRAFEELL